MEWYQKAADNENTDGMIKIMVIIYYDGYRVSRDYGKAYIHGITMQLIHGTYILYDEVLVIYAHYVWGMSKDYGEAIKWYRKAADNGNTDGMMKIADLYYDGNGVSQDYGKDMEWYQRAVDNGNTDCMMIDTGNLYYDGDGVSEDYGKAMEWYRKAADNGNTFGMMKICDLYSNENGVSQDYSEAMEWYQKAVDNGIHIL